VVKCDFASATVGSMGGSGKRDVGRSSRPWQTEKGPTPRNSFVRDKYALDLIGVIGLSLPALADAVERWVGGSVGWGVGKDWRRLTLRERDGPREPEKLRGKGKRDKGKWRSTGGAAASATCVMNVIVGRGVMMCHVYGISLRLDQEEKRRSGGGKICCYRTL
jgi:hypothetical protein